MPTPHISAEPGDFAEAVLLPGDPLRAKFIAEKYLEIAFRALYALDMLDTERRSAGLWYYRGLLNAWIWESDTSEEARAVAKKAAVADFEYFVLKMKAQGAGPEDDSAIQHALAKLKILRK